MFVVYVIYWHMPADRRTVVVAKVKHRETPYALTTRVPVGARLLGFVPALPNNREPSPSGSLAGGGLVGCGLFCRRRRGQDSNLLRPDGTVRAAYLTLLGGQVGDWPGDRRKECEIQIEIMNLHTHYSGLTGLPHTTRGLLSQRHGGQASDV